MKKNCVVFSLAAVAGTFLLLNACNNAQPTTEVSATPCAGAMPALFASVPSVIQAITGAQGE